MGILGRINRVIRSNVNQLIDKMSDPAKEVELLITEMEAGIKDARQEVVSAVAAAKRAAGERDEQQQEVDLWHGRAQQAVRAGDDELARVALARRMEAEAALERADRRRAKAEAHAEALKKALGELKTRLEEVRARKETLKGRARAAKEGGGALPGSSAFQQFDRLEERIAAMEAVGEATASVDAKDAEVEARFAKLDAADPEVEDELAALKRRLEAENP